MKARQFQFLMLMLTQKSNPNDSIIGVYRRSDGDGAFPIWTGPRKDLESFFEKLTSTVDNRNS